ncbi:MAG: DUF3570 domain-containing protein [Chitinophagaceae bacterium]|nr:DUF3570 domain-containing protein [Chitinophagaceae bacterium]
MKNKYLTLALLTTMLHAHGQQRQDSLYKKQRISRTDIQVLFGYYTQNGDHSAITGGRGTEQLHVYSPEFTITHHLDSARSWSLNAGVDVISSASLDNIDFIVSSASKLSARTHISPSYTFKLKKSDTRITLGTGISVESAYLSFPAGLSVNHTNPSKSREWSAGIQCYFDDLRYGWISAEYLHPVGLIYPAELRDTSWFPNYRRNSYNLSFAWYQVLNARMQLAIFPELVYQKGLLSTPYHRVYFRGDRFRERVEKLPIERWKFPLAAQLNIFAGARTIIRSYYRWYHDDLGITAHTLQFEVPVKLNPALSLAPLVRLYTQTAARYFAPYGQHDLTEKYYTSDYDLSKFNSYKTGLTIRYAPQRPMSPHYTFNALSLRYSWYKRSDGLAAHILTLLVELEHTRSRALHQAFSSDGINHSD